MAIKVVINRTITVTRTQSAKVLRTWDLGIKEEISVKMIG
jgi:hypothetical protein